VPWTVDARVDPNPSCGVFSFFLVVPFFLLFVNAAPAASEREIIGSGARQSVRTCHRCIDPPEDGLSGRFGSEGTIPRG